MSGGRGTWLLLQLLKVRVLGVSSKRIEVGFDLASSPFASLT